ncbi:MAG: 1-deoxy-D-xylulose-5-phosphate reductoisomerase [Chlamydiia bacterium]|nr:1-deoxy-D-xylulose-5-phosphate reductoisomerase [Chlamydiia bacterium]
MKKIAVLGSTGSIGQSTLKVVESHPSDFEVMALGVHSNIEKLARQIIQFHPKIVAVFDPEKAAELATFTGLPPVKIVSGEGGMREIASMEGTEFIVMAIVGMAALGPTLAAIDSQKTVGLASKEVLAAAGEFVMKRAKSKGAHILPIDSEHSALFQCLLGEERANISRLILTASGGPFRHHTQTMLEQVTVKEALAHPTWKMGPKVTIDSSTLMNKGLEMIEASFLFDFPPEKISIVVHPQSIVHSFVECVDGTLLAQMGAPNMIYPIQYALTYPERKPTPLPPFDLFCGGRLDFYPPALENFPAIELAYSAMRDKKSLPCYLNAANEVLVEGFLQGRITWKQIMTYLEQLIEKHSPRSITSLEEVFAVDREAREEAQRRL